MLGALSRLRSYDFDSKDQDIRGWPLRDANGNVVGTVSDLIIDTQTQHVAEVQLKDGRRLAAHDVLVGDRSLTIAPNVGRGAPQPMTATAQAPRAGTTAKDTAKAAAAAGTGAIAAAGAAVKGAAKTAERTVQRDPREPRMASDVRPDEMLDGDLLVPLVDEELQVGKRVIDAGGVRVKTHVVAKPFDKDIRLREEHVTVERRRVNQPVAADQAEALLHDRSIAAAATSEAPIVQKQARVVEEIVVKKQAGERVAHIHDTLRHTEVDVVEFPSARTEGQKGNGR